LTIGPNGKIKAELFAKAVVVLGEVKGNVTATEKVDIRENGSVEGDITAPRVAIAEGAHFRGSVDMAAKGKQPQQSKPLAEVRSQSGPQGVVVTPNPQNQQNQAGQPQGQRAVGA
jgi:cytoskeletal protein CcmA (bactofilin family)